MAPRTLLIFGLLAATTMSCSSGDGGPTDPPPTRDEEPVTRTIDPAGGSITASSSGVTVTVTFPPGALRDRLDVTLRPADPAPGSPFGMLLEPINVAFEQAVGIEVEYPDGAILADLILHLGDTDHPWYLPTEIDADELTARTTVNFFGLNESFLRSSHLNPNLLGSTLVDCDNLIAALKRRFDLFVSVGEYMGAVQLAQTIAATLNRPACFSEMADWLDIAEETACDGLADALNEASGTVTNSYGVFLQSMLPILEFQEVLQKLNINSNCAALQTVDGVIDAEIAEFVLFFNNEADGLASGDYNGFLDLRAEAEQALRIQGAAAALGAVDAAATVDNDAFRPAMDILRSVAYDFCQNDAWHIPLSRLTSTGFFAPRDRVGVTPVFPQAPRSQLGNFTDQDIWEDLQYCGTELQTSSWTAGGVLLEFGRIGGDGAPGASTKEVSIDAPTRGTLRLANELNAFWCWNQMEGDDEITLRINASDVFVVPRLAGADDYVAGSPVDIDIATIAQKAGITPMGGNSQFMTLMRRRSDCDILVWGPNEYILAEWTVVWQNPTLATRVELPAEVGEGQEVDVAVRVEVIDQRGQGSFFEDVDVVLNALGGSLATSAGKTDGAGYFRTKVTVDGSGAQREGALKRQFLQIDATATSFEGVSDQGSATALIAGARAVFESGAHSLTGRALARKYSANGCAEEGPECYEDIPFSSTGSDWDFSDAGDVSSTCQTSSASGSFSIVGTTDASGAGVFSTIDANVLTNGSATGGDAYQAAATASAGGVWFFNVLDGPLDFEMIGSCTVSGTRTWGTFEVSLREVDGENRAIQTHVDVRAAPSANFVESGQLRPGRYMLRIAANGSPSAGCGEGTVDKAGQGNFSLVLTKP